MDLKNEITRTENLEIKLQKGITNINDVIVRGGGVQSTSVAQIPENITKMLGQYSKVASGSINSDTIWKGTGGKQFNINFAFTPKRIIALIIRHKTGSGGGEHLNHTADSDVNYSESTAYFYAGGVRGCYIKNITKNGFFLGTGTDLMGDNGLTIRWIAIG